jgi:hypothetical protein
MELAKNEDGVINLRFKAAGIEPTTFAKDDDLFIQFYGQWPAFYEAHQADVDLLIAAANNKMFNDAQPDLKIEAEAAEDEFDEN